MYPPVSKKQPRTNWLKAPEREIAWLRDDMYRSARTDLAPG